LALLKTESQSYPTNALLVAGGLNNAVGKLASLLLTSPKPCSGFGVVRWTPAAN